jgi:hypothetical protein
LSVLPRPRTAAARALAAPATVAAIVVAGLLLSACATMPPERCAEVDWQQQGIEDGRAGFGPTRLARHREACAGIGVVPDQAAWEQGHALGLLDYCQLPNALQQGLARHAYEGVCADPRFRQLYGAARRLADERQKVVDLDHQIDWRERELLTNPKLTEQRRAELTAEARSLHRERERAIDDRADATRALERVRDQVGL